jgi:hypothetical protein
MMTTATAKAAAVANIKDQQWLRLTHNTIN